MPDIYEMHDRAFQLVSAYVIAKGGKRVATIAFKLPKDGAGRLWCYVHWIGQPMVRSFANGFGYDKRSAAASAAAKRIQIALRGAAESDSPEKVAFVCALAKDDGYGWDRCLQDAGFTVWQAV